MNVPTTILVSHAGLALLSERLERLQGEYRTLCQERATACELCGDGWHDNPYLNQLQQREARKTMEIREVETLLQRAQLVTTPVTRPTAHVALGSIVRLSKLLPSGAQQEQVLEVVGWGESDASRGHVAYNAPLVQPLLGLVPGDEAEIGEGRSSIMCTVVELLPEWPRSRVKALRSASEDV
jgi:transcription elongation GreA/GreB family factor